MKHFLFQPLNTAPQHKSDIGVGYFQFLFGKKQSFALIAFCSMLVLQTGILPGKLTGQTSCGFPFELNCSTNDPSLFTVISTTKTFTQMIIDQELLPQSSSSTAPQYLIVCEDIIDNVSGIYTFAEGSEIIFINNQSGLTINANATLIINNGYLHGCEKVWDRIQVNPSATLHLINQSVVEDAFIGVSLSSNSTLQSIGTNFESNVYGIYASAVGLPGVFSVNTVIKGNVFSGANALLESVPVNGCTYTRPIMGILAQNLRFMSIGSGNASGDINYFEDFENTSNSSCGNPLYPRGIYAFNSNITVRNSVFRNIDRVDGGRGIDFICSPGQVFRLDVNGLGKTGSPTFSNVGIGIRGHGNISATNAKFQQLIYGVEIADNSGPYTINLSDNSYSNIEEHAVFANQFSPITGFNVKNSTFDDNNNYIGITGFARAGVYLQSFIPGNQSSLIQDNTLTNSVKSPATNFNYLGVYVQNLNGGVIDDNTFTDNLGTSTKRFDGARLFKSTSRIENNTFTGAGNFDTHPSTGIQIDDSPACFLKCNSTTQTTTGIEFKNMNCDNAQVRSNTFDTHKNSLLLRKETIIRDQDDKQNTWVGSGTNAEALFEGRDPFLTADIAHINQSNFIIRTTNTSSDFWPDPRKCGTTNDPGVWFFPGTFVLNELECFEIGPLPPNKSDAESNVISGTYQPVRGFSAGTWEAKVLLYQRMLNYPELRPESSVEATWFAAQQNATAGLLSTAYNGIYALSTYTAQEQTSLQTAANAYNQAISDMAEVDSLIAESLNNASTLVSLSQQRVVLDSLLGVAANAYQVVLASIRSNRISTAQQLLSQVNAVSTSETYETDFKTVCKILLEGYVSDTISTSNLQSLRSIAHQCRYEGGLAVLQARASLTDEWDFSAYDDCTDTTDERAARVDVGSELHCAVSPNPATREVVLNLGHTVLNGQAMLRDINGRQIATWSLDGLQQTKLQWGADLANGMYLLEVIADNHPPKMVKLHIQQN